MKTINKTKTRIMKKNVILMVVAIMLMPLTAMSQNIFDKYSDNNDVTFISVKPKMFQMLAKIDVDTDDPETKEFVEMVNSITSFKTIATDNKAIAADIANWVKSRSNSLEELMEVKDDGMVVKFYVKEGKDSDHVEELLMFVNGLDAMMKDSDIKINGKERSIETVVISFTGNIDLNQISKLTKQMNLPGGNELNKGDKKKK
jgi:TusA-related sulfurtransferase